jgi:hypothetical protein
MKTLNKFSKPVFIILLISGLAYEGFAQRNNLRQQSFNRVSPAATAPANDNVPSADQIKKVQRIRENYFMKELDLTPAQRNQFLRVYRAWQNDMDETRRLKRLNNSAGQSGGSQQLERDLAYDRKLIDIKENFQNKFLKVLPAEKLGKLYKLEQEFKDEIFKNLNERQ